MTDLLISIFITGIAITYAIEFFNLITVDFFGISGLNKFLTLPLSLGGLWLLDARGLLLIVAVPAAGFISLYIGKQLEKPVVTNLPRLRGL
jgi:hypothetical protein